MGRPPKPTALKVLSGAQPCRVNRAEPKPKPGRPEPPDHLDDDARAEWLRLAPELEAMGVLTRADGPALAVYCVAFSRWLRARQALDLHGLVIETDLGGVKANPAAAVAKACEDTMRSVLASFGADPSSRSKVAAQAPPAEDRLAALLAKRQA